MAYGVCAILLAAGLSARMGGDKLLLRYRGGTLLERAANLLAELPVAQRILVTTETRLGALTLPPSIRPVVNPHPEDGQSGSLRLGLAAAEGDYYLFLAADQPRLTREAVEILLRRMDGVHIIFPTVNGIPRNPVLFPEFYRAELMDLEGDTGGRVVRMNHPEACLPVPMGEAGLFLDIDTRPDYDRLLNNYSSESST